jgi:hypothetical protein
MAEIVSIIIAVISLVGSIIVTSISGFVTLHSDRAKRLSETEQLVSKYRDPLLAAADLQSDLHNIIERDLFFYYFGDENQRQYVTLHVAFLFGRYFSWVYQT